MKPSFIKKYLTEKAHKELEKKIEFIFSFNDINKIIWDSLILLMALWKCAFIPFNIAFKPGPILPLEIIHYVIDLFFYIDIGV